MKPLHYICPRCKKVWNDTSRYLLHKCAPGTKNIGKQKTLFNLLQKGQITQEYYDHRMRQILA